MRLYVHVILCGSICTLMYILWNNILPYALSLKWKRFLIRVNIGFYLLPIPWLVAEVKGLIQWMLEDVGMILSLKVSENIFNAKSVWKSFIVLNEDGKLVYITGYQEILPVMLMFFVIGFILLGGWVVLYARTSRRFKRNMVFFDTDRYLKDSHMKRRIIIGISPCVSSPVTVGLVKPAILFPVDYHEYENTMEEVILHEMNHVSCMDIVERFLGFVVIVVHFFNPLAYYLYQESVAVSEMLSDEAAVKGRTKKQKADYIRCIIVASQKMDCARITVPSLGLSKSLLRKRMEQIMEINQKKRWKKKMTIIAVSVCALASSIPALAYQKPRAYVQNEEVDWNDKDLLVFSQTGEGNPMDEQYIDFGHGNIFFDGEDGIKDYNIMQEHQTQKTDVCAHSYTSGTISEHNRHADGSCTVVTCKAQKCTKCGNAIRGDEVSTFTYKVCPHLAADESEQNANPMDEIEILTTETGVVNTNALKVRAIAELDGAVITLLKEGTEAKIVAEENDFYKIIIESEDDTEAVEGYVRKEYLSLLVSETGMVDIDALKMRVEAEMDAEISALLKEGTVVRIISEENDFYKVITKSEEDGSLLEGYVRKEYLDFFLKDSEVPTKVS